MNPRRSFPELADIPTLTAQDFDRLASYGTATLVSTGDLLFRSGEPTNALHLLASAVVEVVRPAVPTHAEARIVEFVPGQFVGEFTLLTGQNQYLTARVVKDGTAHRIGLVEFRRMMAEEPELSDLVFRALLTRRQRLRDSPAQDAIQIVGPGAEPATLALRRYAERQMLPHRWLDSAGIAGRAVLDAAGADEADLPLVVLLDDTIRRANPGRLSERLGLAPDRRDRSPEDVVIVGAGPAGLAAAIAAASEGLRVVLVDAEVIGGQAARSSRIENLLGFPFGLSGADLAERAQTQALKFGARIYAPCAVTEVDLTDRCVTVHLTDGTEITAKSLIVATGARYRTLPVRRWAEFEGRGIHYAATELEARACEDRPVVVLGGANSAGQAALFLASRGSSVTLVLRGSALDKGMSDYLVRRIRHEPRISVTTGTEVVGLDGDRSLNEVTFTSRADGATWTQPCGGLFCFIGATPATGWLSTVALDADGFVLTDVQLDEATLPEAWVALGRRPLPYETSVPRVLAIGDVRVGAMKRVAAAMGEGSSAIASLHRALAGISF